MLQKATIILSLLIWLWQPDAFASKSILWLKVDIPPISIIKGDYKNQGIHDYARQFFQKKLTGYKHEEITVNALRRGLMLKHLNNVCAVVIKTPEREKFAYFAKAHVVSPPLLLITTKKNDNIFDKLVDKNGYISLKRLLSNKKNLKLGIVGGRSYGSVLDKTIAPYKKKSNILLRIANDVSSKGLFEMMSVGRVDYIIEYPWTISYTLLSGKKNEEFHSIPFKELEGNWIYSNVACSKTKFGKEVISQVNQFVKEAIIDVNNYSKKWMGEETTNLIRRHGVLKKLLRN